MKTYELTTTTRRKWYCTLTQIRAVVNIPGRVVIGDLGGWIESETSIGEDVWVDENAEVFSDAVIHGGVIHGGVIHGGEIWGGVIRGGLTGSVKNAPPGLWKR